MSIRKVLFHGAGVAAVLALLAAFRPGPSAERRVRAGRKVERIQRSPREDTCMKSVVPARQEGESRPSSMSPLADLGGLSASDLCARLEAAGGPEAALGAIFVLGNTMPIGHREVETLVRTLSRWENDVVRCQALWALGLAWEAYPLGAVLDVLRSSSSVEVRCSAVASMAGHLDEFTKRAVRNELSRETDARLCHEIERSLPL